MSKMEPSIENIFGKKLQPYWGIVKLLKHFRRRKKGLELICIRYIFIKNHDRDRFDNNTFRNLEGFYKKKENDISHLYEQGDINTDEKKKTPPGNSIINYLQKLVDLGIIYKPEKGVYKLMKAFEKEMVRDEIKNCLYSYKSNEVIEYEEVESCYWMGIDSILLGIREETQEAFTDTEKRQIRYNVKEIERLLWEIDRINFIRFSVECDMKGEDVRNGYISQRNVERVVRSSWEDIEEGERSDYPPLTFVRFSPFTTELNNHEREQEKEEKRMMDIQIKAEKKKKGDTTPD